MIYPRLYEAILREMLEVFPVVAVVGARQVGKSTLVQGPAIQAGRTYYSLDEVALQGAAQRDPLTLLNAAERVTVDEVQRVPGLLLALKREVDKDRTPGRFLLTGSADLNVMADLSRTLAGRVGILRLPPLLWREQEGRLGAPPWLEWISLSSEQVLKERTVEVRTAFVPDRVLVGGYPLSVTAKTSRARALWFESYRQTYLERDVRQVSEIGRLADFARLMEVAASRTGQLLNQAALARDVGLSAATAGRYFSVMEATFQLRKLTPFFRNIGKRLVKSPKLYWTDAGVACHLLGLENWGACVAAGFSGPMLETFVLMEVFEQVAAFLPQARVFFWRTHAGQEIDGLIVSGQRMLPFEVKSGFTVRADDARSLRAFLAVEPRANMGLVFYPGDRVLPLDAQVLAVPYSALIG